MSLVERGERPLVAVRRCLQEGRVARIFVDVSPIAPHWSLMFGSAEEFHTGSVHGHSVNRIVVLRYEDGGRPTPRTSTSSAPPSSTSPASAPSPSAPPAFPKAASSPSQDASRWARTDAEANEPKRHLVGSKSPRRRRRHPREQVASDVRLSLISMVTTPRDWRTACRMMTCSSASACVCSRENSESVQVAGIEYFR
jgi:hypothetical protein